jgi:hypothetical protein
MALWGIIDACNLICYFPASCYWHLHEAQNSFSAWGYEETFTCFLAD